MKIITAFLMTSLVSVSALANFTGTWQGRGNYTDGEGYTEMCSAMKLEMIHTPTEFTLSAGTFECESLKIALDPFTLSIQDGTIVDKDGINLGNVDDHFFYLKITNPQTQWVNIFQGEITVDGLEYKQTTVDETGSIVFTIDGVSK